MYIMQPWSKIRENSPRGNVTLWTFVLFCMIGSSPVLSIAGPERIHPKRDSDYGKNSKPTELKADNKKKLNHRKENCKKNLGCLPRSAMFNVVSSTALNLNVLGNLSSNDRLLYFFGCSQWNGLLIRMKFAPKIRLQPLCVNCECSFLRMCNLYPSVWKDLFHCERS